MNRPELGLCCEVEYVSLHDGDTVRVKLRTGQRCHIRLIECWCPELKDPGGPEARAYQLGILSDLEPGELRLYLPPFKDTSADGILDIYDILKAMSFSRVPGRLFIGEKDVSAMTVAAGHATQFEKPKAKRHR